MSKRLREENNQPRKRLKLDNWYNRFTKEKNTNVKTIKDNHQYKVGLERCSKILDGYMLKYDISNYQFKNIELMMPTSFHLIFREIHQRYKDEISNAIGCFHNKKGVTIISDRGVGKTFQVVLWATNIIRYCPGPYKIGILGVQLTTAINLLYSIKNVLNRYDIKADFDEKPQESVLQLRIKKNGEEIVLKCFAGRGEGFRGDNEIELIVFDEFAFADPDFIQKKVMAHLLRNRIGMISMTTRNTEGHNSEMFMHSTDLIEVQSSTRICSVCAKLPDWEDRKKCKHGDPPDAVWQDERVRDIIAKYMPEHIQAPELYGDTYRTPDYVFEKDKIDRFINSDRVKTNNFSEYILSIDPNQEGPSENATTILGIYYNHIERIYVAKYINTFKSNVYNYKISKFKEDLDILVSRINKNKRPTYVFVEANSGNVGKDLEDYIKEKRWTSFIKVIHGKKWDKKLNKYLDVGYAKTAKRTKFYVDNFSQMMEKNTVYFHDEILTNTNLSYNTVQKQIDKLHKQLNQFRNIKGKVTGKMNKSGYEQNDDSGIAFLAGLAMGEELNDPNGRLISEKIRRR